MKIKSITTFTIILLFLVLAMASSADAIPYFEVDQSDRKDHYMPSDWITINVVDFNVIALVMDAITDNGGLPPLGTAGAGTINPIFGYRMEGYPNYGGMLMAYVDAENTAVPPFPVSGILYSFEYHVPDVQYSTIITIETFYDDDLFLISTVSYINSDYYEGDFTPVAIHVVPEPATLLLLGLGVVMVRRKH